MSQQFKAAQQKARSTIDSCWSPIAKTHTVGWGAVGAVEMLIPDFSSGIDSIRHQISSRLPIIIYNTRESPPKSVSIAVPYESHGDPYKCHFLATDLPFEQVKLLSEFAQAIWFLIDSRVLPHPSEGKAFENMLVEWTGAELIKL